MNDREILIFNMELEIMGHDINLNVSKNWKIFINSLVNQQWILFFQKYWTKIKKSILRFSLLWLMFAIHINISYWNEWSGDIYPIFHGYYISNWYGEGVTEEYSYCYLDIAFDVV